MIRYIQQTIKGLVVVAAAFLLALQAWAVMGERSYQQESLELEWRGLFINVINHTVMKIKETYSQLAVILMLNPPVDNPTVTGGIKAVVAVLQPLYVLAILATALYLLFMSTSPSGRLHAKNLLTALLVSMVAVSVSTQIIKLLYQTSAGLTQAIINKDPIAPENMFLDAIDRIMIVFTGGALSSLEGGQMMLVLIFFMTTSVYLLFSLRYLVLLSLTFVFPASIFLYTFNVTRSIGRSMLEQMILWTFMQPVIAAVFMAAGLSLYFLNLPRDLAMVATLLVVAILSLLPVMTLFVRRFLP